MRHGRHTIRVVEGTIGPAHDPYGYTRVEVHSPNGDKGVLHSDGLGRNWVKFYSDTNGCKPVREFEWTGLWDRADKQMALKANIIARRALGLGFDEAFEVWHSAPDMGCPKIHM